MLKVAGEIGTKSARTRRRFLRFLVRNVEAALRAAGVRATVEPRWSRVFVDAEDLGEARAALADVFGLHSLVEIAVLPFDDLDTLISTAADVFRERVTGRTFAVRAKRSGEHDFHTRDVVVRLGAALLDDSAGVNLSAPDVEVRLEVTSREAYAFLDALPGTKGLPLGSGHRALALFSGGFDSPVAAWYAMRRGTEVQLLVFELEGFGQADVALGVAKGMAARWAPGLEMRVHVVDFSAVVLALRDRVEPRIRQVLLKRAMYRAGTIVARLSSADALVTGEALGQVSTQTLRNLAVAEQAAGLPILRPLIGLDKEEIIATARRIGTHDASARVREHCAISVGRVETAAKLREVVSAEGEIDEASIADAVRRRTVVDVRTWEPAPRPSHVVDEIPEGAVVVDVREPDEGATAGDLRLPFSRVDAWAADLDPAHTYVFVCTYGVRSSVIAGELAARGLRAHSLADGLARLPVRAA